MKHIPPFHITWSPTTMSVMTFWINICSIRDRTYKCFSRFIGWTARKLVVEGGKVIKICIIFHFFWICLFKQSCNFPTLFTLTTAAAICGVFFSMQSFMKWLGSSFRCLTTSHPVWCIWTTARKSGILPRLNRRIYVRRATLKMHQIWMFILDELWIHNSVVA